MKIFKSGHKKKLAWVKQGKQNLAPQITLFSAYNALEMHFERQIKMKVSVV